MVAKQFTSPQMALHILQKVIVKVIIKIMDMQVHMVKAICTQFQELCNQQGVVWINSDGMLSRSYQKFVRINSHGNDEQL